jgi:hypothetical protein
MLENRETDSVLRKTTLKLLVNVNITSLLRNRRLYRFTSTALWCPLITELRQVNVMSLFLVL